MANNPPATAQQERPPEIELELSAGVPIGRDDETQPMLRVDVFKGRRTSLAVPYFYGYPLHASSGGLESLRKLRHENWQGYEREESEDEDGVVRVTERFPSIGCRFEGILQERDRYLPLYLQCDVPPPRRLGGRGRSIIGGVKAGASAKAVLNEPTLQEAFLGDWHVTTRGFSGKNGTGYFATAHGLLAFGFEQGDLTSVAFLFDTPIKAWREPELWAAP